MECVALEVTSVPTAPLPMPGRRAGLGHLWHSASPTTWAPGLVCDGPSSTQHLDTYDTLMHAN